MEHWVHYVWPGFDVRWKPYLLARKLIVVAKNQGDATRGAGYNASITSGMVGLSFYFNGPLYVNCWFNSIATQVLIVCYHRLLCLEHTVSISLFSFTKGK